MAPKPGDGLFVVIVKGARAPGSADRYEIHDPGPDGWVNPRRPMGVVPDGRSRIAADVL